MKRREPPSSNSDDEEYHPAKVAAHKLPLLLSTLDLPVEVLHHIITFMQLDELAICSIVSKTWCELVDRRCKGIIQHEWKSNLSCLEPANGSWRSQLFQWCDEFSKLKHGLPKVTWCVENGADVKLLSLLHSPPPHRKRFLRLLNPPTMLRMEDSPLHYACAVGCVDVVEIILSYEVAKECLNKPALGVSHQGISAFWTPLHYAISYATASGVFAKWLSVIPYSIIYENFHVDWFNLDSWWTWLIILLAVDCGYYWTHREMHMINIGWAGHSAHHSSEYYNLTTAVRQSGLGHYVGWMFYLPLALFFPPSLYIFHYRSNLLYQYWIHTDLVTKTHPLIEFIFNTPSHHRVHHARNPEYLDKNFGGVLIIWDRMFGTFAEEKTTPYYGLVHTLQTWGAMWSQFHHLVYLFTEISTYKSLTNKIAVVFAPPGWTIDEKTNQWVEPDIVPVNPKQPKYRTAIPNSITAYLVLRFAITSFVHYVFLTQRFSTLDSTILCIYIVFCLETYSLIMDRKPRAFIMELNRSAFDVLIASYFLLYSATAHFTLSSFGITAYLATLLWLVYLRDDFRSFELASQSEKEKKIETIEKTKETIEKREMEIVAGSGSL